MSRRDYVSVAKLDTIVLATFSTILFLVPTSYSSIEPNSTFNAYVHCTFVQLLLQ